MAGRVLSSFPSSSLLCQVWKNSNFVQPIIGSQCLEQVRTNVRKNFARPSERKRISKFAYEERLKTPGGRAVLMRRILKGRFVLSH